MSPQRWGLLVFRDCTASVCPQVIGRNAALRSTGSHEPKPFQHHAQTLTIMQNRVSPHDMADNFQNPYS